MPTDNVVSEHSLLLREIRPIRNWHEWLVLWKATENLEWMESLLHVGFSVSLERAENREPEYDETDRVSFYLTVADNWNDHFHFESFEDRGKMYRVADDSDGNSVRKVPADLRQQLARKAFYMLCQNFFKIILKGEGRYVDRCNEGWQRLVLSPKLFPVIQNFFRSEKKRFGSGQGICNLPYRDNQSSHGEQQVVTFLLNLAKFLWGLKPDTCYYGSDKEEAEKKLAETLARVSEAKPWMIEVLVELDELDMLREWLLELDKACFAKLRDIALRSELVKRKHWVKEDRRVSTLDEACFAGSKAAWLLKEYLLKKEECQRLKTIREEEQAVEESTRKIGELTAKRE
jgi:hypothetical protein